MREMTRSLVLPQPHGHVPARPSGRFLDWDRANQVWTFLAALLVPFGGSVLTFLFWGAVLWNLVVRAFRAQPLPKLSADQKAIASVCAVFAVVHIARTLVANGVSAAPELAHLLIFLTPAILMARLNVSDPSRIFSLLTKGFAIGTIVAAVIANSQVVVPQARGEAFLGNAGVFAVVTLLAGSLGALNLRSTHLPTLLLGAASLVAMYVCVILSQMRGILVLLPVHTLILLWVVLPALKPRVIVAGALVAIAAVALGSLAFFDILLVRFQTLFADYQAMVAGDAVHGSLGQRMLMWFGSWGAIGEQPIWGYGLIDRMDAVRAHIPADAQSFISTLSHPHNAFLTAWLDAGIAGLVSVVVLLATPLVVLFQAARSGPLDRAAFAFVFLFVLTYLGSGMTNIMLHHDLMDAFFLFMLVMTPVAIRASQPESPA